MTNPGNLMRHFLGALDTKPDLPSAEHRLMTCDEMLAEVRRMYPRKQFTQAQAAAKMRISVATFCNTVAGGVPPPPKFLAAIGFERVVLYRRKRP